MSPGRFDVAYIVLSGTTTATRPEYSAASRAPSLQIPTPTAARTVALRELAHLA
jgi:hypothetical protein